jgi:predicted lipoprotein with Yx(FWY)xxD motif
MRLPKYVLLGVAILVAVAATTSVAFGATRAGTGAKVAVANTGLGPVLVDGHGRTLYLFAKDRNGKSACAGQCAGYWPPLITSGKPVATAGAKASLLGTTRRPDGRLQVTYNHHPLYTFVKDTRKGQTNGEELRAFGAEWYAVSATGAKVEKNDASTGDPMPSGGYGYAY